MSRWHVALGTAVVMTTTVALAAAGCSSSPPPGEPPAINLPSRTFDAGSDGAGVLDPLDAGAPADAGAPPPDPFCQEPGLIGCFAFEGSVTDGSEAKLAPSQVDGVTFATGKVGRAAKLEPATVIRFPFDDALNVSAATVEAWIYRDVVSFGDDTVFDNDARFAMTVEQDGTLRCNTALAISRGGKVAIAAWVHVACVFDGATIKNYVNGVPTGSAAGALATDPAAGAAIGDNAPGGGEQLLGMIDSLRVFSVSRTAAQVAAAAQP